MAYPPGGTFFDTLKRSFTDVPVESGKIATSQFLEAAESLTTLFGVYLLVLYYWSCSNKNRCPRFDRLQACQVGHDWQHQGTTRRSTYYNRNLTHPRKFVTVNSLLPSTQRTSKTSFATSSQLRSTSQLRVLSG